MTSIAKWDFFELALPGPADGNPYLDVAFEATFTQGARAVRVPGFYDGEGTYRVRFMPDAEGEGATAVNLVQCHAPMKSNCKNQVKNRQLRQQAAMNGG
jgi:hypothetical protein